jgi:ABC-2 type transport system ATP-binding protein
MADLIEASHLRYCFGERIAVQDVSLHIAAGEIYGLVGPDGAGKTTTLRMLCGAYRPASSPEGHQPVVNIAGYDMLRQTELARAQIGYLPQRFSLYEDLTVMENIRFFAEVRGLSAAEWRPRSMEILTFVGLNEFTDRRAGNLSGGMKQKLGLAAALVHKPRVLLLDEPTTGVDPVTRQDFWQLIIRLVGRSADQPADEQAAGWQGTAVLVCTPYMDEAARCARVGFMSSGRLMQEGPPARLCTRLSGRVLEMAGSPLPVLRKIAEAEAGVMGVQMFGDRLHLRVAEGQAEAVMAGLTERVAASSGSIERLRLVPPQLEDVFMELLEEQP